MCGGWFFFGSESKPAMGFQLFPFVDIKPQCLFFLIFFGVCDVLP